MKLVSDWKDAWRWLSVHCMILIGGVPTAWAFVPAKWQDAVPAKWMACAAMALVVLGILGRIKDQNQKK